MDEQVSTLACMQPTMSRHSPGRQHCVSCPICTEPVYDEGRRRAADGKFYTYMQFQAHYDSLASWVWNHLPIYGDTHDNQHNPPSYLKSPLDADPDMDVDPYEIELVRRQFGWWLTDRQCQARIGRNPLQERIQASFERRERMREIRL